MASTASFSVKPAFDAIVSAGLNVNLSGKDTALRTVNLSGFNDWSGTFSMSKRSVSPGTAIPNCSAAAVLVDMRLVLTRGHDGYRMQEGATFGYDADYKPVCALLLDGNFWRWTFSQPLPVTSKITGNLAGVEFSGDVFRGSDNVRSIASLTSLVGLDADTASSANLSFVYSLPGGQPFQMLGETTEFRFRIDPAGNLLGFEYLRTGVLPTSTGPSEKVTLTMRTQ